MPADRVTTISVLASDTVVRVGPRVSLRETARVLADGDVGAPVVAEDGDDGEVLEVLGTVSERDDVRALAADRSPDTTRVIDIASTDLVWCDESAGIGDVASQMMEHYLRHVLVERDGRLVGIVSARDLLGAYASAEVEP